MSTGDDGLSMGRSLNESRIARLEERLERLEIALEDALAALPHDDERNAGFSGSWSSAGYPSLPPRQLVSFDGELDPRHFLVSGWWDAEGWGVWGRDGRHSVRLHIPGHSGGYVELHLTVRAFVAPGGGQNGVSISANGYFLGAFILNDATPQKLVLRLPPSSIDAGNVILYLHCSNPVSPAEAGVSDDRRTLGVGFVSMMIP